MFLYIKKIIDQQINDEYKIIFTIPAYFGDNERTEFLLAAKVANLNILNFINEPTAGSLAYSSELDLIDDDNILVFDFGGGTLDLSLLTYVKAEDKEIFQVIGTYGDNKFGGIDITKSINDYICNKYNILSNQQLETFSEFVKINIENKKEIYLKFNDIEIIFTINDFDNIIKLYKNRIINIFDKFIDLLDSQYNSWDNINLKYIYLIGGSSKFNWLSLFIDN